MMIELKNIFQETFVETSSLLLQLVKMEQFILLV